MQITKKEFRNILTNNKSVFFGRTKHYCTMEEILDAINEYFCSDHIVEQRTCKEQGKYLVFSGGSRLDINDNEYNKYTCECIPLNDARMLISRCKWYDTCDDKWNEWCLYYLV